MKSFEVPKSYLDKIRASAVTEDLVARFPDRPIRVDVNKAPDQFGLRPEQIERLINEIIQGSGEMER